MTANNQTENYDYEDYYYEYDPALTEISVLEMVVPLLVYSITFTMGLVGNILILVAVRGQTQVDMKQARHGRMRQRAYELSL